MKRYIIFTSFAAVLTLTCACHPRANSGGVDGSGGDIQLSSMDEIQKRVSRDATRELRLATWRMRSVLTNTTNFSSVASDAIWVTLPDDASLMSKFLGDSQDDLDAAIDRLTIRLVDRPCVNVTRQERDAAVNLATSEICLNYDAFKRFSGFELENNLIAILMHELSHLRGFNEAEAQRLQYLVHSPQFGAGTPSTILLYQETPFWELRRRMTHIGMGFNQAIMRVYSPSYRDPGEICELIAHFGPKIDVGEDDFIMDHVPGYLKDMYESSVTRPFLWQSPKPCLQETRRELAKSLADAAQIFGQLQRAFSLYIDRHCTTDSCVISFGAFDPAAALSESEYLETMSLTDERAAIYLNALGDPSAPRELTSVDAAVCRITDPGGRLISEFSSTAETEFKSPLQDDPSEVKTHFTITRRSNETFLRVHAGDGLKGAKLINAQGFYQLPNGFEGLLQKGSTESISAQFSVGLGAGESSIVWENDLKFDPPSEFGRLNIHCRLK